MDQSSRQDHSSLHCVLFGFFALTLLFVIGEKSSAAVFVAQADWRVELEEGQTTRSQLGINNHCSMAHHFRIKSELKHLSFEQPTESVLIEAQATKRLRAVFDATGAKSKVYRSKVGINCLDCKDEPGCSQDRDELTVEMAVVKRAVTQAPRAMQDNPQLALNKRHEPNPSATTWQIGVPITYVITVKNTGASSSLINVTDTLPPGFVFMNATCTTAFGAVCPSGALPPPTGGVFTTPALTIPTGGEIEIRITGYFKTSGTKINHAVATAGSAPVGSANTSQDQLDVPSTPLPVDIKVEKFVNPASATFPAHLHYTVKVTNNTSTPVNLGGILKINDILQNGSSSPTVNWSASNFTCTPSSGADCPDLPSSALAGTLPAFSSTSMFLLRYDSSPGANDTGLLPGNASYTIEFDVDVTTTANCMAGALSFRNQTFLDLSNGVTSVGDQVAANNTSQQVSTTITGLSPCPPSSAVTVSKIQVNPPGNAATWNAPVTYRVTVANPPDGTSLSNIPLSDSIFKTLGTPTFTATVTSGPTCVSGCSALTSPVLANPTVNSDFTPYTLWTATLPSLGPSQQAVIEYKVIYVPVCETDPRPDVIINRFTSSGSLSQVQTNLGEWERCQLALEKTKKTSGPIIFGQPFEYEVVYKNLAAAPLFVGTVRDVLSISGNNYTNSLPFDYSISCTATAGAVTTLPAPSNVTGASAKHESLAWQGVKLLNQSLTFGANSTLTCKIIVTVHQPADDNPFCKGAGNPQLVNSAYMDLSTNYNPNDSNQPGFYASQVADLPLCRKVIVTKTTATPNVGPGATVVYKITVENKGNDAVNSLTLTDVVQPPLIPIAVSPCNPAASCISSPTLTGNVVNVAYGPLQPNQPVSFDLTVTAPQAGGSYRNLAVGSFLPGGNFYFQGDEGKLLQQEENITVLTPTLTKSFDPVKIGPNGTSTLTFTITNINSDPPQTGIGFSDTLPPGLVIDSSSVQNGCSGTVSVSADGRTLTLTGGQLIQKHSCQIVVKVKATGVCGVYKNNQENFSNVKNLDVSNVNQQLEVTGCESGLIIRKNVEGATAGYTAQFNFLVQCSTPSGFYQKTVTVNWPTPGFVALNDVPAGSQCTVTEGPPLSLLPVGYNWSGLPVYSPAGGFVKIDEKGGQVTVRDKMEPCEEAGQVQITKIIKGVPKDFTGVFEGTLQCWVAGNLITYSVTLTSPNGLTATVDGIPLGSTCTFKETVQPSLSGDLLWLPPDYSPNFGTVTLSGECCQEIIVTNWAKQCCNPKEDSSGGEVSKPERSTPISRPPARRVGRP